MPGSAQITSSVARVSALIGLNDRLPQSLIQISSRILARIGALRPAAISAWDRRSVRSVFSPEGSPSVNRSPSTSWITPGSGTSAAG